jgi:diguanylate cyclase (GGDEF)-like protein
LVAAAVLLAALVALLVQWEVGTARLIDEATDALAWLAVALVGGSLALGAWWRERRETAAREQEARADERRRAEGALEAERAAREEAVRAEQERRARELQAERDRAAAEVAGERERATAELEAERERAAARVEEERSARQDETAKLSKELEVMQEDLRDRDLELDRERRQAEKFRARDARERDSNRQLRREMAELQAEHGSLGAWRDVPTLILQTAVALTDAEKGVLLTREDEDGDGDLDLAAHVGFDSDDPGSGDAAADAEIRNLVAIPIYVRDQFSGVLVCANREGGFEELEDDVLLAMGDQAGAILQNARLHQELRGSYLATVSMLAEAIQAKDPFLRGHSEEVTGYVTAVAERLAIDGKRRERLVFGSLLHDVGKIGISERILHKPDRLTPEEFAIVQLHPRIGYRLLEQVPALRPIAPAILHHHERYDGGGYPTGLRGEQIPLEARIVAVADAFSAMTADRPYRPRMALEEACAELEQNAGTQFDPEIVRIFTEEVRCHPPETDDPLAAALDDAELQVHRAADEPVLGATALSLTDSLTLLYSHRYLHEAASAEAERSRLQHQRFVIVLAELDDVHRVNTEQSYGDGDALIRRAARSLTALAVRSGGTACREGGVVLALLVPGERAADPAALEREVAEALEDAGAVRVAAAAWLEGDDGEAVIARARTALDARAGAV